jgi:hypothetical protein
MGLVVTYGEAPTEHERAARSALARALAALQGYEFGGSYEPSLRRNGHLYYVPGATLEAREARALGIESEEDLFGGVVPHCFVGNKTIAHALPDRRARAPEGWLDLFPEQVRDVVLPGFSAFTRDDAARAAKTLLASGPVRIKPGYGVGGKEQAVVEIAAQLDPALAQLDPGALAREGLVVERNLEDVTTYSVGQVLVGGLRASYCGTQKLTRDNRGEPAYGGSDLLVARGGYDQLLALEMEPTLRVAICRAQRFDAAAAAYRGIFASRRNYDVLRGRDRDGKWHCGVLEQSWRIGGASGPEVAALGAFRADARLRAVHARSTEAYGEHPAPPPGAIVHFHGVDSAAGPLAKYTIVEPHARAR